MGFVKKEKMELHESIREICVLDFETTGLKAGFDRTIEAGVVVIQNNIVVDQYQTFMNPGFPLPEEIIRITGIEDHMLKDAPKPEDVMADLRRFIKNRPIMCHNSSFDKRFIDAEMNLIGRKVANPYLCTLMMSRRLFPNTENHKLPTLAQHFNIVAIGAHRALADAIITAGLWVKIQERMVELMGLPIKKIDMEAYTKMASKPAKDVEKFLVALGKTYKE